jgi:hypothetical protein
MLKNENEGNFKINFYADNRKEWKFFILRDFSVFTITFIKGPVFGQKNFQNKIYSKN